MAGAGSTNLTAALAERAGDAMALNDAYLNPQLGRIVRALGFDRVWVRGDGAYLVDDTGARYLDLLCGYGVFAVGRAHPRVVAALRDVLEAGSPNLPQLGVSLLPGLLAQRLLELSPDSVDAMVPANSGAEAVDAAIKLARASTGRPRILFAEHAFHGLTLGALSLNGNEEFREGFGPLLPGCDSVAFGDLDALSRELAASDVAAFVVEPVQGKGVNLPPPGYLERAQQLCRAAGTLFCCDEVQTGLGRTGRFFALEHWGLQPDMITVAKALSGGFVPTGGVLVSRAVMDAVFDGMERGVRHGSTFGGNDLAAAAGIATLDVLHGEGLVANAARLGELLLDLTRPLVDRYEIVHDVRGLGLMWAIELGRPESRAARRAWDLGERAQPGLAAQLLTVPLFHEHRILCQVAGHRMNVVKALPALVATEADIRAFATALDAVIARAERLPSAYGRLGIGMARRMMRPRRSNAPA
jgi:ornithine--oxo-acid transaminase